MTLIKLESVLKDINERTTFSNQYPVLTSSKNGICLQETYFKKQVASNDNTGYKIIKKGQFTYRAMSDTGEFFPNMLECVDIGIVSPAYPVFEVVGYNILNPYYLKYYFKSKRFQNSISLFAQGSTRTSIKYNKIKTLELDIPNVNDQLKIVKKLDLINDLISEKKDLLEKINALIKSQFVEMFEDADYPYVPFKEYMERCVDIGSNGANAIVMKHYNITDIKDYAMVIRFTNLNSGDFEKDIKYLNKDDYEFYSKSKVYGDEIIFCKIGSAGENYIMPKLNIPVTLGLNQIMVTPQNINTRYLYEYINSNEGKKYIKDNINGAVTKTITKHALWDFPIKTPPIELQIKFADFVKQVDKQKFIVLKMLSNVSKIRYLC